MTLSKRLKVSCMQTRAVRGQCVGDTVLLRQDKTDKFSTTFNATPHKIISRTGNKVVVVSPTGVYYVLK